MEIQEKTVFPFIWKGGSPMLTAYKHDENHRLCPVAFEEMEKGLGSIARLLMRRSWKS